MIIFVMLNTYMINSNLLKDSPKANVISHKSVGIKPFVVGDNSFSMEEIWKDIKDFEGYYMVSSLGNVKAIHRTHDSKNRFGNIKRTRKERQCIGHLNNNGYLRYQLSKGGKIKNLFIQRIVATAFIPNPNNLPCVLHKDDDPLNNNENNLFWGTQADNIKDKCSKGRQAKGVNNGNSVLTKEQSIEIKNSNEKLRILSSKYGVSMTTISNIKRGLVWV